MLHSKRIYIGEFTPMSTGGRPTGSNLFHPSHGPLAAILPLLPRRVQLPIPLGLDLLLMVGASVQWRVSPRSWPKI